MPEPKGPPCGFLGLGSSSGASANVSRDLLTCYYSYTSTNIFGDMKNGGGRDFGLALRRNVGRYGIVDAPSDVSMVSRRRFGLNARSGSS
jgi:hypothetical protein